MTTIGLQILTAGSGPAARVLTRKLNLIATMETGSLCPSCERRLVSQIGSILALIHGPAHFTTTDILFCRVIISSARHAETVTRTLSRRTGTCAVERCPGPRVLRHETAAACQQYLNGAARTRAESPGPAACFAVMATPLRYPLRSIAPGRPGPGESEPA